MRVHSNSCYHLLRKKSVVVVFGDNNAVPDEANPRGRLLLLQWTKVHCLLLVVHIQQNPIKD